MEQYSQSPENEELLSQTVSDVELREILERIGHEEFTGNPQPTIRDIVEGTSADASTIGRILGDIRKEDWEKRFGLKLKDHEHRIETLETKPAAQTVIHHYHEVPVPTPAVEKSTSYNGSTSTQYGYGSKTKKPGSILTTEIAIAVLVLFSALVAAIIISSNRGHQASVDQMMKDRQSNPFPGLMTGSEVKGWPTGSTIMSRKDMEQAIERAKKEGKISNKDVFISPFGGKVNQADIDDIKNSMRKSKSNSPLDEQASPQ